MSEEWLVYRAHRDGRDVMLARSIAILEIPARRSRSVPSPAWASSAARASTATVVFAVAKTNVNRIVSYGLDSGKGRTVLASRNSALSNPSVRQGDEVTKLLYVRATAIASA